MPSITLHRVWCDQCQSYELHQFTEKVLNCRICNHAYDDNLTSIIPEEKLLEQRKRYKDSQRQCLSKIITMSSDTYFPNLFNSPGSSVTVIEHPAGQNIIDDERKRIQNEEKSRIQVLRDDYENNYKHLTRNNTCSCNSGKKYKVCHLPKFTNDLKL